MSNDLRSRDLDQNLSDASSSFVRPDGTFSDDTVMNSLNLAIASARQEQDSNRLVGGASRDRMKGIPRLEVIRMEEGGSDSRHDADADDDNDSELFILESSSTPAAKRGRGRPKGSLDRNPRSVRNSKAVATTTLDEQGNPLLGSPVKDFDSDDATNTPSAKRKPGRPRKDRTNLPSTPRVARPLAGVSSARSAAAKAAASAAVMTPERREANRLAAERSRLRKAEKAVILEKMAKGLTEENVALKDKIKTLTSLGLDEKLRAESEGGRDGSPDRDWLQTGHPIEAPDIDPTLEQDMSGTVSQVEGVQPPTGPTEATLAEIASIQASNSNNMAQASNGLQQQLQQRIQNQIEALQAVLREDDPPRAYNQVDTPTRHDAQFLKDVAAAIRKENEQAKEKVRALRDELLQLDQTTGRAQDQDQGGEGLWVVDPDENEKREAALTRHADVEAALIDMKRHLGQLMTHYDLAPPELNGKRAFSLPEKFELIPLPQPMKRGRPSKPPTRTSEGEPPVKRPRGRPSGEAKLSKNTPSKRAEQFRRYRVEGDPDNIYIEKRLAVPGSADEQVVEVTSRRLYNPRSGIL